MSTPNATAVYSEDSGPGQPGSLVQGNFPVATSPTELGDSGKAVPAGAVVGTTDAQTLSNKYVIPLPPRLASTNVTLDDTSNWLCVDCSSGPVTVTVPAGSVFPNRRWTIKKTDITPNLCTLVMSGSDLLDGDPSLALVYPGDAVTIQNQAGTSVWGVVA